MHDYEHCSEAEIAQLLGVKSNALGILGKMMPGGFIQYEAPDLATAVMLAADFKANGHYKYFRGQRDSHWEVISSFARANKSDRDHALTEFNAFYSFARGAPQLVPYLQNDDAIIATAQHHGLALTNFIDFTHSPEVAGWFASDGSSTNGKGAIFLVDTKVEETFELLGLPFRFLHADVPNLWRLQSQQGLFLEAGGKFDHIWPLDRIIFPHLASNSSVPRNHIYPDKKSSLELALDQYELIKRRNAAFDDMVETMRVAGVAMFEIREEETAEEDEPLLVPPAWIGGPDERWSNFDADSTGPILDNTLLTAITPLTELIEKRRNCANLLIVSPREARTLQRRVNRVWEGMRPYPYSANQIARSINATARLHRAFEHVNMSDGQEQRRIATEQIGESVEIEMSTSGGNAARAYVSKEALWFALKADIQVKLGRSFDPGGGWISYILYDKSKRPGFCFDSERLIDLFADQITPWQVATNRDPIAFSAFHILRLGRP